MNRSRAFRPLCYTKNTMGRFRTLIIWLLLLTLPLKGYASVSMVLCKSGVAGVVAASSVVLASDAHLAAHHHASVAESAHGHQHEAASIPGAGHHALAVQAVDDSQPSHCISDRDMSKCSNCASCCVGAAISPTFQPLASVKPLGSERIPYAAMYVTAHIPNGLERPPHSLPA